MESVRILRIAAGGDGVAKLSDGRTVFVPRTAPGDVAELAHIRPAKRFARARLARLVDPSPERTEPPCPHYTREECGGCQLQHLNYEAQLQARRGIAGDALRRLGGLDVADPAIEPAGAPLAYRTKITLAAGGGRIGLHPLGRADLVFDLDWCHITAASLNEFWQALRRLRRFLPANLDQLVLRLDRSGGRHLLVRAKGSTVWTHADKLARGLADAGERASLWWQPEGGASRIVAGEAAPAPDVFEQVHPDMADRARRFAVEQVGELEGRVVWDLYAGVGDTTAALARRGARVHSVELDRRAVAHAEAAGPSAQRHVGPAETLVATLPAPERVIVNPPRIGMDQRVAAALLDRRPQRIVYVSCDPATLARDVARLAPGYRLAEARCFDLFPQTAHVETVAVLESA